MSRTIARRASPHRPDLVGDRRADREHQGVQPAQWLEHRLVLLQISVGYRRVVAARLAEVGVNAQFSHSWSAYAAYSGRFGDSSQGYNGGQVGVKYAF